MKRQKPILIVQHAHHEHPAVIRRALESQGLSIRLVQPYLGESYPKVSEISGMISLGGPMGANDEKEHPWIRPECLLLREAVETKLPVVGICLGGQLMAKALGGRVERHKTVEVGWFPVDVNEDGLKDPLVGAAGAKPTVYHWHGDTFHLPAGAQLLAGSKGCARQAYRTGEKAYGFQFHPEADHQLIGEWLSVEGVEEEIKEIQKAYGAKTVQSASAQRNHALKGEKSSLKITAAIGSLFRDKPEVDPPSELRSRLERWGTAGTVLRLQFEGSDGKITAIEGRVTIMLSVPGGDFVIFQEENTLLWPIRLEDIREITPKSGRK